MFCQLIFYIILSQGEYWSSFNQYVLLNAGIGQDTNTSYDQQLKVRCKL